MGNSEIRNPIQKRSIEKKEKIIEAGFELMCRDGYYKTNTAKIAKHAGVSTGIVYQYFNDKHDILIEAIKKYSDSIFFPMISVPNDFNKKNFDDKLDEMINEFVVNHKLSQTAHEEITAMQHSDEEIAHYFFEAEIKITETLQKAFINAGFNDNNLKEKTHLIIHIIDDLCHEIVYHQHDNMNYKKMTELVIYTIKNILNNNEI